MTFSNREIVSRFLHGRRSGQSSNMGIEDLRDRKYSGVSSSGTILVDYGWACLAHRTPGGKITLFDDWYGYSVTTSSHINLIKPGHDRVRSGMPVTGPVYRTGSFKRIDKWPDFPYDCDLEAKVMRASEGMI